MIITYTDFLSGEEIMKIIQDLKEKDRYQFSEETTKKLLE